MRGIFWVAWRLETAATEGGLKKWRGGLDFVIMKSGKKKMVVVSGAAVMVLSAGSAVCSYRVDDSKKGKVEVKEEERSRVKKSDEN